jgi:UDPglucose 6-dehydrogenase
MDGGGKVQAYDPIANETMKEYFPDLSYCNSWAEACDAADAVAIMTDWNEFRGMDLPYLKSIMKAPVILDTRNILSIDQLSENGFQFNNVGRKTIL